MKLKTIVGGVLAVAGLGLAAYAVMSDEEEVTTTGEDTGETGILELEDGSNDEPSVEVESTPVE